MTSEFFQRAPELKNTYSNDTLLVACLKRLLPSEMFQEVEPGLKRLGDRARTDILKLGLQAEAQPPRHIPYDPWGKRIDKIEVSDAWLKLEEISAEERIVATAYDRKHGALSRIHHFTRVYLFNVSSAIFNCPLAMTDGSARAIELYGDETMKRDVYTHLVSGDPKTFWTSGQWMTERTGGSDVSMTSTIAKREGDSFKLYGTKWFTSATTSQCAMTLARIEGAPEGSKGLSIFQLHLRNPDGSLNGIQVNRLKDKMGTKALPTAELTLNGCVARLVGDEGNGVKKISSLFNITRIWNACCAVSSMQRGIELARDYAEKRVAFGKKLIDHPLHAETLFQMDVERAGGLVLTLRVAELLGKEELSEASAEESALLRLLTPVVKLYTAKQAIQVCSEALECFGGAGYIEDTGLPKLARDAQVLSIWEGTTNVLSLDTLRAIQKENVLPPFFTEVGRGLPKIESAVLQASVKKTLEALQSLQAFCQTSSKEKPEYWEKNARSFAFKLARIYSAYLLLQQADWGLKFGDSTLTPETVARWCEHPHMVLLS